MPSFTRRLTDRQKTARTKCREAQKRRVLRMEPLEDRRVMTGDLEFGDDWGVVQRSSANGTTLDFSAVTGGLLFTIAGDSVTVGYLDSNRGARLTYDAAGQSYSILGSRAKLRGADFRGAELSGANLGGLDLRGASLVDARLQGADFSLASLIGVDFAGAVVDSSTKVAGALFIGALSNELRSAAGYAGAVRLDPPSGRANLADYRLAGFDLSQLNLSRVDFTRTKLAAANLRGAVLDGASLVDSVLDQAFIFQAKFAAAAAQVPTDALAFAEHAVGGSGDLSSLAKRMQSGTVLAGYNFSGFDLSGINFAGIDLTGAQLAGASLSGAQLANALLSDSTDFSSALLSKVTSLPNTLTGQFSRADL